jgi:cysteine desulfurase
MATVYFDNNSTTALKPKVLEAMLPWLSGTHGNPTSRHVFGRNAREAVEKARQQVANAVGVQASQVVFTSGGTEANNFAIKGIAKNVGTGTILTSAIEHPCVSKPAASLVNAGWVHKTITVNKQGQIDLKALEEQLLKPTDLMSVMLVNNETGVVQPLVAIAALAKQHGVLLHTDAVQALGKMAVDFYALGVNAMTISSHKIGGPLGVGALILDKRVDIAPLLDGGGQERGLRSGTENTAAIVGFGMACDLAIETLEKRRAHTQLLTTTLEKGLTQLGATIFGQITERVLNTSFFAITNI